MVTSFYIHWPFCPLVASAERDQSMGAYHVALLKELEDYCAFEETSAPLKTVFFGGGTPSIYPLDLLRETTDLLESRRGFDPSYEMTIEVTPGTVSQEHLLAWKELGINRLSIRGSNVQDESVTPLRWHEHVQDLFELIGRAAPLFENLSVDLTIGLPGVTSAQWKEMIATITEGPIQHIALSFFTEHEARELQDKPVAVPTDDEVAALYYWTIEQLGYAGIRQYEISHFARPGWESGHNSVYWNYLSYKGFGLGACSFDGQVRSQNEKNLVHYIQGVRGRNVTVFAEKLSDKQVWFERLMLGLCQLKGVWLEDIVAPLSIREREAFSKTTDELMLAQLVSHNEGRIALTQAGLAVANEIIVKLSCIDQL